MARLRLPLALIGLVFAAPALAAPADEAVEAFNSLYGEEVKRVLATRDTSDDTLLAAKLFEAAKTVSQQPELMSLLCEKTVELGRTTPTGRATAVQAMELLAAKAPERKAACLEKIVSIRQIDYDTSRPDAKAQPGEALVAALLALADAKAEAGDSAGALEPCRKALAIATAIKSEARATLAPRLDRLAARVKMDQRIAGLRARLEAAPTDAAVRMELVRAILVDLDNPAEAAKFTDASLDAAWQKDVPAAARGTEETPELACQELGDWYRGLADPAAPAAKPAMLGRARAYYQRFLALHKTEDVARAQVTLAMRKLDESAAPEPPRTGPPAKAPPPAAGDALPAGQWLDVLKYVDTNKDPTTGSLPVGWQRQGATVVCTNPGYGSSRLAIPVMPQGSYELQVRFALAHAHGDVGIFLPAGAGSVMLQVDGSGVSGLEYVNGSSAYSNGTGTNTTLAVNRIYTVDIRVTLTGDQAEILAALDSKPLLRWQGPQTALSPYYAMDHRCLGLYAYYTTATFGSLRLKMLSGDARLYKPEPPKPAAPATTRPPRGPATSSPPSGKSATPAAGG
ncbi:MAG: hypothetical protein NTX87_12110 [Planctomycetota bacterium]|nr:hypothetical protein [Planctomycetota bacterium]